MLNALQSNSGSLAMRTRSSPKVLVLNILNGGTCSKGATDLCKVSVVRFDSDYLHRGSVETKRPAITDSSRRVAASCE